MKLLFKKFTIVLVGFFLMLVNLHYKLSTNRKFEIYTEDIISNNSGGFELFKSTVKSQDRYLEGNLISSMKTMDNVITDTERTQHTSKFSNRGIWSSLTNEDKIELQLEYSLETKFRMLQKKNVLLDWGTGNWGVKEGDKIFHDMKCKVKNCNLRSSFKRGEIIQARLFTQNFIFADLPEQLQRMKRDKNEVWILFILESPNWTPNYRGLEGVFNWTATYRMDSTIPVPYFKWTTDRVAPKMKRDINIADGKTNQAAMFVSHCDTVNERLKYAQELAKHMPVDIYGSCGNKVCSRHKENKCLEMLKKQYKFYLAFENSNCREYITEKFFRNALTSDVLPVVMGAHPDDYRKVAPPNSYIHVEDFKSPKELAAYLHKLDKNDTLYNEYFKWKGTGSFINTKFWCRLCAMLNDPNKPELVVESMESWWRPPKVCLRPGQRWSDISAGPLSD